MPFISKDWRSPGEHWVKTGTGWERVKVLQFNDPPHFRINVRKSRENRTENVLGEALVQLDFASSSHDIRRVQFISKLLSILSRQMHLLPGNVQKCLLLILKQLAIHVRETRSRTDVLTFILHNLRESSEKFWGGNLGSNLLWQNHKLALEELDSLQPPSPIPYEDPRPLTSLPEEIIRCILLKLDDHKDVSRFSETHFLVGAIGSENRIWRALIKFHFGLDAFDERPEDLTWEEYFHRLKRKHGLREEYAGGISICRHCGTLFWESEECAACAEPTNRLDPDEFLEFFSV